MGTGETRETLGTLGTVPVSPVLVSLFLLLSAPNLLIWIWRPGPGPGGPWAPGGPSPVSPVSPVLVLLFLLLSAPNRQHLGDLGDPPSSSRHF